MSYTSKIKNHLPHNKLSSKLWEDDMKMKKEVRNQLIKIADAFMDYLGVTIDVKDITLTGSYANYNYTPYSDIDLHLIVDYSQLTGVNDLAKEFFHAKKSFWNNRHDIKIKGIEVELYAQDETEPHSSTGVYSIEYDKWIIKPKKFKTLIDQQSIRRKYEKLKTTFDLH